MTNPIFNDSRRFLRELAAGSSWNFRYESRGCAEARESNDPMLKAMQTELDREKALLLLPGMQRPYFIEYRLDDIDTYEAVANYGALTREEANHHRLVRVDIVQSILDKVRPCIPGSSNAFSRASSVCMALSIGSLF